ncbi:MAG: hypothetical protein ACYTGG_07915 [Planctomycetota bacterium]|jgi:uncharacterized membrane protein YphA (DoxX/SURF4 family)
MDAATRLLNLAAPGDEPGWRINIRWLSLFVLLHVAARSFLTIQSAPTETTTLLVVRILLTAAAVTGACAAPARPWASRAAAGLLVVEVVLTLPMTANHVFLELVCLVLFSLLDPRREDDGALAVQAFRWLAGIMFFYTGFQKLLWGFYFDGQFLAWLAGTEDRFAAVFRYAIRADEFERILSYRAGSATPGRYLSTIPSGPYRVDSFLFVALSNAVYVFEMLAGILLLLPRTRVIAAVASIVFVIFIELGARELTFGALMTNLLLLYLPGPWIRRLFPVFLLMYAYLAANALGLVPMFDYSPA